MIINFAHRGASSYLPENTMEAFRMGLTMGATGIETDIHRSKDGVLVLFHDDKLARATGAPGKVTELTFAELQELNVTMYGKTGKIPTFAEFLEEFGALPLTFAIELKQEFTEAETIDMLRACHMTEKVVLTSFKFDCLLRAKLYGPEFSLGYLTHEVNELTCKVMKTVGIGQLCPEAKTITPELVKSLHAEGFNVRAWGVKDEAAMRSCCEAGVDGMTVNFPDKLTEYLQKVRG